ncbi:sterol desaturase family protein [Aureibaculum sp. 2210JD6-5]|uniref:sterol desaturase family protein n=1 Tax=Aureibaculum sp. 2210JD6-5 TaxID=3103957 RepID=UPI002AAEE281|nr:sterol desaturase family protein [Aureibaculum sp. 2210JD6-5]MDY7394544.1 sterol desaturase family protein [Aureibaculum sp. 2210JD6-5]
MQQIIETIIYDYSYFSLYGLTFVYFLFLYFVLAPLFLSVCKLLNKKGILHKIINKKVKRKQLIFEIKHSFKSIVIFGFSVLPIIYLIRIGKITLLPDTFLNIIIGIVVLTVWNEIHFFVVHRIMHLPFFMKRVHFVHHQSRVPTVWSVYSFHWFEAFLLSTVPLTIMPFVPFSIIAVFLYPLASILLNYAGHCNYRFGDGYGNSWKLFGTFHNEHHSRGRDNYGFASNALDKFYQRYIKKH